jgi:hypothetical protein
VARERHLRRVLRQGDGAVRKHAEAGDQSGRDRNDIFIKKTTCSSVFLRPSPKALHLSRARITARHPIFPEARIRRPITSLSGPADRILSIDGTLRSPANFSAARSRPPARDSNATASLTPSLMDTERERSFSGTNASGSVAAAKVVDVNGTARTCYRYKLLAWRTDESAPCLAGRFA